MDDVNRREFLKIAGAGAAIGMVRSNPVESSPDLCFMSARDLAGLIRARKISAPLSGCWGAVGCIS